MQPAGLPGRKRAMGPPTTEHVHPAAACGVLAAGGGLAEAGQLLRQASPQATAVYARSDIAALRSIARPWPGTAR
jgi:integrase/recombinase XerD